MKTVRSEHFCGEPFQLVMIGSTDIVGLAKWYAIDTFPGMGDGSETVRGMRCICDTDFSELLPYNLGANSNRTAAAITPKTLFGRSGSNYHIIDSSGTNTNGELMMIAEGYPYNPAPNQKSYIRISTNDGTHGAGIRIFDIRSVANSSQSAALTSRGISTLRYTSNPAAPGTYLGTTMTLYANDASQDRVGLDFGIQNGHRIFYGQKKITNVINHGIAQIWPGDNILEVVGHTMSLQNYESVAENTYDNNLAFPNVFMIRLCNNSYVGSNGISTFVGKSIVLDDSDELHLTPGSTIGCILKIYDSSNDVLGAKFIIYKNSAAWNGLSISNSQISSCAINLDLALQDDSNSVEGASGTRLYQMNFAKIHYFSGSSSSAITELNPTWGSITLGYNAKAHNNAGALNIVRVNTGNSAAGILGVFPLSGSTQAPALGVFNSVYGSVYVQSLDRFACVINAGPKLFRAADDMFEVAFARFGVPGAYYGAPDDSFVKMSLKGKTTAVITHDDKADITMTKSHFYVNLTKIDTEDEKYNAIDVRNLYPDQYQVTLGSNRHDVNVITKLTAPTGIGGLSTVVEMYSRAATVAYGHRSVVDEVILSDILMVENSVSVRMNRSGALFTPFKIDKADTVSNYVSVFTFSNTTGGANVALNVVESIDFGITQASLTTTAGIFTIGNNTTNLQIWQSSIYITVNSSSIGQISTNGTANQISLNTGSGAHSLRIILDSGNTGKESVLLGSGGLAIKTEYKTNQTVNSVSIGSRVISNSDEFVTGIEVTSPIDVKVKRYGRAGTIHDGSLISTAHVGEKFISVSREIIFDGGNFSPAYDMHTDMISLSADTYKMVPIILKPFSANAIISSIAVTVNLYATASFDDGFVGYSVFNKAGSAMIDPSEMLKGTTYTQVYSAYGRTAASAVISDAGSQFNGLFRGHKQFVENLLGDVTTVRIATIGGPYRDLCIMFAWDPAIQVRIARVSAVIGII